MKFTLALFFLIFAVYAIDSGDAFRLRRVFRRVGRFVGRGIRRIVRKVGKGVRRVVGTVKGVFKFGQKVVKNWSKIKKAIGCFKTILSVVKILGDTSLEDLKMLRDTDLQQYNEAMYRLQAVAEEEYGSDADELMEGFDLVMDLDADELNDIIAELDANDGFEENLDEAMFEKDVEDFKN